MSEEKIKKAVALKYDIEVDNAPSLIAKGKGEAARNIIRIAQENELPIKRDEDLVELLTKIDVNKEIPENMYKAIAEVFSFIYDLTKKSRSDNSS